MPGVAVRAPHAIPIRKTTLTAPAPLPGSEFGLQCICQRELRSGDHHRPQARRTPHGM